MTTTAAFATASTLESPSIQAFGAYFVEPLGAPSEQARVYAYRPVTQNIDKPINIYLGGHYHASLLPGGYSAFCINAKELNIQSVLDDASQAHLGKLQLGLTFTPNLNSTLYLRVIEAGNGGSRIQFLPESTAASEIRKTRLQLHTISRAPESVTCNAPAIARAPVAKATPKPKPAPQAKARQFNLKADALFYFGKDQLKPSGKKAIDQLITQIEREYTSIQKIRIFGFTDAIGPDNLNKRLSQQRADTVSGMFRKAAIKPAMGIDAIGKGSNPLVQTNCGIKPTPANKECQAPNRRVVIEVDGVTK
ncbi:MAG: outer membrane protein precursor [Pseudomonadota bacterium]